MFTFDGLSLIREKQVLGNKHNELSREITGLKNTILSFEIDSNRVVTSIL